MSSYFYCTNFTAYLTMYVLCMSTIYFYTQNRSPQNKEIASGKLCIDLSFLCQILRQNQKTLKKYVNSLFCKSLCLREIQLWEEFPL